MKFLIIGPGAMGCLFAARLHRAGHPVTLLDYREERARLINSTGIRVEGLSGEFAAGADVTTKKPARDPDAVLVCVKSNQTGDAARALRRLLGIGAAGIVTLQNGLGNVETLEEVFGKGPVIGGVTAEGATLLETGHVRHAGEGETVIGPCESDPEISRKIVSVFNDAGFKARFSEDIESLIWGKLIVNVGINALTAITGLKNGRIPDIKGTRAVMEYAVAEAVEVARARGIRLPYGDPVARVIEVCRATADNVASMLQDVRARRMTEVGFINGAVMTQGGRLGIPTPVNETLTRLVEALQATYGERPA